MASNFFGENFYFLVMLTIFSVLIAGNAVAFWRLFQGKRWRYDSTPRTGRTRKK